MEYTIISDGFTTAFESEKEAIEEFSRRLPNFITRSSEIVTRKTYFEDRKNHFNNYKISVYIVNCEGHEFKELEYIKKEK